MQNETYLELTIPLPETEQETAAALLAELGMDAFLHEDGYLLAYIPAGLMAADELMTAAAELGYAEGVTVRSLEPENWNAQWESNFEPVAVHDFCHVRAVHHSPPEAGYEYMLVIQPQMSFGTGHHETTRLMMESMRPLPLAGRAVLDMGCGSGILALLARMMGAAPVWAADIDPVCVLNTRENALLNGLTLDRVLEATPDTMPADTPKFGCVLANIVAGVLLASGPQLAGMVQPGGWLLVSGFFDFDRSRIIDYFEQYGLQTVAVRELNNWQCVTLQKPS